MSATILWVDDEIELLKPHIVFLSNKGFNVITANNGNDALKIVDDENIDIIFLDENMPGLSGIDTLMLLNEKKSSIPIVMITKSEEESIMEDAIGQKISDYLIKPVNPHQILLSLKKNLDKKRIISEKTFMNYQQEFREISMQIDDDLNFEEWSNIYKKIIRWELALEHSRDNSMYEILKMQKDEANSQFCNFIENNYLDWIKNPNEETPLLSHDIMKKKVFPLLSTDSPVFFLLIDNLRLDQWFTIKPVIEEYCKVTEESIYSSILPSSTQYARNSIFSGLMPLKIQKRFPDLWKTEIDEEGKNLYENEFLDDQMNRNGLNFKTSYNKITNLKMGKKLEENFNQLLNYDFNVIVYNFVDMLSHSRTEMEVIKELAESDSAYCSLTLSWFEHSALLEIIKNISKHNGKLIITTDHGTIQVKTPSKVIGNKNTNTNLRYKVAKTIDYNPKDVLKIDETNDAQLPKSNLWSQYIFAKDNKYFVYQNNYNYYMNFYNQTFQHGGISMEEMLIPFIILEPK